MQNLQLFLDELHDFPAILLISIDICMYHDFLEVKSCKISYFGLLVEQYIERSFGIRKDVFLEHFYPDEI
jgi:hypothetical protein